MGDSAEQNSSSKFPIGSFVEVNEGLKGGFFVAFVVPYAPFSLTTKLSSKKLYVEYLNLFANEDGSEPLREIVDPCFVRPHPPPQQDVKGFGPSDSVDAFYEGAWWPGIITQRNEGGRFIVTFQNPPVEREFGLSELRVHWDWFNGSWLPTEKQNKLTETGEFRKKKKLLKELIDSPVPATGVLPVSPVELCVENIDITGIQPCESEQEDLPFAKNSVLSKKRKAKSQPAKS